MGMIKYWGSLKNEQGVKVIFILRILLHQNIRYLYSSSLSLGSLELSSYKESNFDTYFLRVG